MLCASMNPCPCGFHNHPEKECMCSGGMVQEYLNRISGPLHGRDRWAGWAKSNHDHFCIRSY